MSVSERPERVTAWRRWLAVHSELVTRPAEWLYRFCVLLREALPVAVLRRHEIETLVRQAYSEVPDFYDPAHYPIRYEAELTELLRTHCRGDALLDLYCGHGREAELFAAAGFEVFGVDQLDEVIERARRHAQESGFSARFESGDVAHWRPPHTDWDVVYTSLWMYSTIPDRAARVAWLTRLATWVAGDGVLVVSVTPRRASRSDALRHAIARTLAALTFNARRPELGDRFHTGLFWHDVSDDEAREDLSTAGLTLLATHVIEGATPCTFYLARPLTASRAQA